MQIALISPCTFLETKNRHQDPLTTDERGKWIRLFLTTALCEPDRGLDSCFVTVLQKIERTDSVSRSVWVIDVML